MKLNFIFIFSYFLIKHISADMMEQSPSSVFDMIEKPAASPSNKQNTNNLFNNENQYRFAQGQGSGTNTPVSSYPTNQHPPILGPPANSAPRRSLPSMESFIPVPPRPMMNNNSNSNSLQAIIDKIKGKVSNPILKDNFTIDNIANFFANFISGNQFMNNLEVKELAEMHKVEVKDLLKVKGEAQIENLSVNKFNTHVLSIDGDEISFNPEAVMKMKNSKINFKIKDIFEVITFMKYIVKICGSKLEHCDFNTLIKNYNANQIIQIISAFQKKEDQMLEVEKKKLNDIQEKEKERLKEIETKAKKEEKEKNEIKKLEKKENLRKTDVPKFKESKNNNVIFSSGDKAPSSGVKLDEIEKEISKQIQYSGSEYADDYEKFIENPNIDGILNTYYYEMPL